MRSLNITTTFLSANTRKQRIEKAIKLMEGSYSLAEISYFTGFSDQSHFYRIFKKQTGESPSDYRKKPQQQ